MTPKDNKRSNESHLEQKPRMVRRDSSSRRAQRAGIGRFIDCNTETRLDPPTTRTLLLIDALCTGPPLPEEWRLDTA
jgi:hypothetical protein